MKLAQTSAAIARGIVRHRPARRHAMATLIVIAAALLMAGVTFLAQWLVDRPVLFLVYWLVCAWTTVAALLLALLDIMILRRESRAARRQLRKRVFDEKDDDGS